MRLISGGGRFGDTRAQCQERKNVLSVPAPAQQLPLISIAKNRQQKDVATAYAGVAVLPSAVEPEQWQSLQDVSPAMSLPPDYPTPSTPESEPPYTFMGQSSSPLMPQLDNLFSEDTYIPSCEWPGESNSHFSSRVQVSTSDLSQLLPMPFDELHQAFIEDVHSRLADSRAITGDQASSNHFTECEDRLSAGRMMPPCERDADKTVLQSSSEFKCSKPLSEGTLGSDQIYLLTRKSSPNVCNNVDNKPCSKTRVLCSNITKTFLTQATMKSKIDGEVSGAHLSHGDCRQAHQQRSQCHREICSDLSHHRPAIYQVKKLNWSASKSTLKATGADLSFPTSSLRPSSTPECSTALPSSPCNTLPDPDLLPSLVSSPEADQQLILTTLASEDDSDSESSISTAPPSPPPPEENQRCCRRSLRVRRKRQRLPSESLSLGRAKPKCKKNRQLPKKPARVKLLALKQKNKKGDIPRSLQLYEFLLHLLELQKAHSCVKWVDASRGYFLITDSNSLAKKWGIYRSKPAMNYDKMSRAMRFYYKRRILDKTAGRLHYKFTESIMKQVERQRQLNDNSDVEDSSEAESEVESVFESDSMSG